MDFATGALSRFYYGSNSYRGNLCRVKTPSEMVLKNHQEQVTRIYEVLYFLYATSLSLYLFKTVIYPSRGAAVITENHGSNMLCSLVAGELEVGKPMPSLTALTSNIPRALGGGKRDNMSNMPGDEAYYL